MGSPRWKIASGFLLAAAICCASGCSLLPARSGAVKTLDVGDGLSIEMVWIPGGTFTIGSPSSEEKRWPSEGPRSEVGVDGFWMGKYEVTQEQYEAVLGKNPSGFKLAKNPVELVNWNEAMEFCEKLSAMSGNAFTLPTEAQWEYACRAGTDTPFHFGAAMEVDQANYDGRFAYGGGAKGTYRRKTTPVGSFPPNAFGLYDMHGNVWEWCLTLARAYPYRDDDGRNDPAAKGERILRGGCWDDNPEQCRSACRDWCDPVIRWLDGGFRVALMN